MKKLWIIILLVIVLGVTCFFIFRWFSNQNTSQSPSGQYETSRTGLNTETNNNETNNQNAKHTETELYSFSTDILSDNEDRLTNIKITCSRINGTIVKSGEEFSFCDVVGKPSAEDGYKNADAFGKNGKIIQAIGGGNCQVSTTIYNAALGVKGLKITERHEHDRDVAYIEDGKDATIAYDYLDLKFKNTNDYDIKLYSFVSDNKVRVKIFKIS